MVWCLCSPVIPPQEEILDRAALGPLHQKHQRAPLGYISSSQWREGINAQALKSFSSMCNTITSYTGGVI